MPKTEESFSTPDVRRDLVTIRRVAIAVLVVCSVSFVIFALPYVMELTKPPDETDQYIAGHKEKVAELFRQEKGLTFRDMVLSWRNEGTREGGRLQVRFDVLVAVDPSVPVGDLEKRADALKAELDKILVGPPRGARVRLVLNSELIRE